METGLDINVFAEKLVDQHNQMQKSTQDNLEARVKQMQVNMENQVQQMQKQIEEKIEIQIKQSHRKLEEKLERVEQYLTRALNVPNNVS